MPKASVKRLIECKKKDLIDLVLDIEKYPEFVPFCFGAKIYENKNEGDLTKIIADLTIGKGPFKDTYKSNGVFDRKKDSIFVKNIEGPLNHLSNNWIFLDKENGCLSKYQFYYLRDRLKFFFFFCILFSQLIFRDYNIY